MYVAGTDHRDSRKSNETPTFHPLLVVLFPAAGAVGAVKRAVRLHNLVVADARHSLQGVDVLRVVPQQQAFLLQQPDLTARAERQT